MGKEYVATKKNGHNNRFTLPNYVIRRLKIKPDTLFKIDIDEDGSGIIVLTPLHQEDRHSEESPVG
jgi:bifunctional DNA-binding transcriptional regulator/antitoxin component of YhaV-PrlF toxin-antitoxin module